MSIKIKVKDDSMEGIGEPEIPKTKVRLDIRKTLDGNFIIQDHPYIDIIIKINTLTFFINVGSLIHQLFKLEIFMPLWKLLFLKQLKK